MSERGLRDDANVVHMPPNPVSCIQPAKWAENHCPLLDRATEWDWMGFYTGIIRDPEAPILLSDLFAVYRRTCQDQNAQIQPGTNLCTDINDVVWSPDPLNTATKLPDAAREVFGARDQRTATFLNDGNAYGVTR